MGTQPVFVKETYTAGLELSLFVGPIKCIIIAYFGNSEKLATLTYLSEFETRNFVA